MATHYTPGADRSTRTNSKVPDIIQLDPRVRNSFALAVGEILNRIEQDDALVARNKNRATV